MTANGQTYTIHAGERGEFNGTDNVTYMIAAAPAADDFDRWANSRDLRDDNSQSAQYVSPDVPGYSDLDENGTWNQEPRTLNMELGTLNVEPGTLEPGTLAFRCTSSS